MRSLGRSGRRAPAGSIPRGSRVGDRHAKRPSAAAGRAGGNVLESGHQAGKKRVVEVGYDQPDGVTAFELEAARCIIDRVTVDGDVVVDALLRRRADAVLFCLAVEDETDRGDGKPVAFEISSAVLATL